MSDPIKRIKLLNAENQRRVTVTVGLLKAARSEIESHVMVNGKGVLTDMVLNQLNETIKQAVQHG